MDCHLGAKIGNMKRADSLFDQWSLNVHDQDFTFTKIEFRSSAGSRGSQILKPLF